MYKIIDTDGREYGPASAEQIRQWIRENRVDRQTRVLVPGMMDWTAAGLLPEFVNDFPGAVPPQISAVPLGIITPAKPIQSNSMAKTGLICGILSVTLCCCCGGLPFNLLGLIFSIIGLVQSARQPPGQGGRNMAIVGLVLSVLGLLILIFSVASSAHSR